MAGILPGGLTSGGGGSIGRWIGLAVAVLTAASAIFKAIYRVKPGERAVYTRWSRIVYNKDGTPKETGEGFKLVPPWSHSVEKDNVCDRYQSLKIVVECPEQRLIEAVATWNILSDPGCITRAIFGINRSEDREGVITGILESALRCIFMQWPEAVRQSDSWIFDNMLAECREDLLCYGVALSRVSVTSTGKTLGEKLSDSDRRSSPGLRAVVSTSPQASA